MFIGGSKLVPSSLLVAAAVLVASPAHAQVVTSFQNGDLNAFVYDVSTRRYATPIPVAPHGFRGLAADNAGRVLYGSSGLVLYRIPFDGDQTPIAVGSFSGATTNINGGLAWDSLRGELIGTASAPLNINTIVRINPQTAATTLVRALGAGDFSGLDYDPTTDRLFGTNDSNMTLNGLVGKGLYAFSFPWETGAIVKVADYPEGEIDIDGCAAGGGRIYLIEDEAQHMHVFNLATNAYETPIFQTPVGIDRGTSGGAWAPGLLATAPLSDCSITLSDSLDPLTVIGGSVEYAATIYNAGTSASGPLTVTLEWPIAAAFVGSIPAASLSGNVATFQLADLPAGQSAQVRLTVSGLTVGEHTCLASVSGTVEDPNLSNNSEVETTTVVAQADLAIVTVAPPPCLIWPGQIFYLISTVSNEGPEPASGARFTCDVPPGCTYWFSTPGGLVSNGRLEIELGDWGVGQTADIVVAMVADIGGVYPVQSTVFSELADPSPADAFSLTNTRIRGGCAADYDASGSPDSDDIIAFFGDWDQGDSCADVDDSGGVDSDDILLFFGQWDMGGC